MAGYRPLAFVLPRTVGSVPMPVVSRALVRPDEIVRTPRPPCAPSLRQAIRARRRLGISQRAIAAELGIERHIVQRAVKDVPPPPDGWQTGGHTTRFNREKAQRMQRAGFTYREIAEDLGCCVSGARQIVKGWLPSGNRPTHRYETVVASVTGVSIKELRQRRVTGARCRRFAAARALLFWLIRQRAPRISLERVGRYLGGFDHASVLYGVRRVETLAKTLVLPAGTSADATCRALWSVLYPNAAR